MGIIVASKASAGGLAALAVKVSHKKSGATEIVSNSIEKRQQDVKDHE
jgi:hypothetical protein